MRHRPAVEPPNKEMEQTNDATARMEASFAAHFQCSPDLAGASSRVIH
jgi:hypothetical protein